MRNRLAEAALMDPLSDGKYIVHVSANDSMLTHSTPDSGRLAPPPPTPPPSSVSTCSSGSSVHQTDDDEPSNDTGGDVDDRQSDHVLKRTRKLHGRRRQGIVV